MGAEVGQAGPGEDQEAAVVAYPGEIGLALFAGPSDEVIARGELPGGGAEAEQGQGDEAAAVVDRIAHLGPDQGFEAEVMVAGDRVVPASGGATAGAGDGEHLQRAGLCEGPGQRMHRRVGVGGDGALATARTVRLPGGRQGDQSVAMHFQHQHPGRQVLESAIGLDPAEVLTKRLGQGTAVPRRMVGHQGPQKSGHRVPSTRHWSGSPVDNTRTPRPETSSTPKPHTGSCQTAAPPVGR